MPIDKHQWIEPLDCLWGVAAEHDDFVFLYSSMKTGYSGRYSWLAFDLREKREFDSLGELDEVVVSSETADDGDLERVLSRWFGYIGYEADNPQIGNVKSLYSGDDEYGEAISSASCLMRFGNILCFDNEAKIVTQYRDSRAKFSIDSIVCRQDSGKRDDGNAALHNDAAGLRVDISSIASNMSKEEYISNVENSLDKINSGEFYQANITRKFWGSFSVDHNSGGVGADESAGSDGPICSKEKALLFSELCDKSPAPYSAYIRAGEVDILSSSPEMFIKLGRDGALTSRPIKGTMLRCNKDGADELAKSEKDRAENLMIVDLMRNDLARVSKPSSVKVDKLYDIDSFSTLHHMSSNIESQIRDDIAVGDVLMATFPPGSMTGAPKIAAMQHCAAIEKLPRGIYSGTIGWIGADEMELSVVIRTLILQRNNRFEFQVGGGIVADSKPELEWQETMTKARGICAAIGLDVAELEKL